MIRRSFLPYLLLATAAFILSFINIALGHWHTRPISSDLTTSYLAPSNAMERSLELVYREPRPRPPLESLVNDYNVTGDASWLLNFAIIGFPKCGTSTLMFHLQNHPEVQIFSDERCDMAFNKQARLIRDLYNEFPDGDYARGLKCPMDVESTQLGMPNYLKYFPTTRFLIGIRHPVLW
ncbi:hypothetical protein FisN_12Hu103 [Fistulifera solaris]|uniref:Sulfotransferase domain-containing protein n=1 Tax=Fistulifera solaris TaxID=1519565 RepID=A0A1Z5KQE0_FISSO|nr:hypothetical protein FisN_12Hu103 [Fistulifera solaris]|eukprot:GAX28530.1 hypothetical protein FisN_12Hu103 [Fistulifera solaris]